MAGALIGWSVAVALVSLAVGGWLSRWWGQFAQRRARQRVQSRAQDAEASAAALVQREGFQVLGRQVPGEYVFEVDGAQQVASLRADLLVERNGCRYVVEVKSGGPADIGFAATRRQLLDYYLHFSVDGVLLADMRAGVLRRVEFDLPMCLNCVQGPNPSRIRKALLFAVGALLALAVCLLQRVLQD